MRVTSLLLPLILLAAPVAAQEQVEITRAADAKQQEAIDLYDALQAEFETAMQDWMKEARAIAEAAEESGLESFEWPERPEAAFVARFQAAAEQYAGTEGAVPFLAWIVQNGGSNQEAAKAAMKSLMASHLASPKLEDIAGVLPYLEYMIGPEDAKSFCLKLEKESGSPLLKAIAAYTNRAEILKNSPLDSAEYKKARATVMDLAAKVKGDGVEMIEYMVLAEIKVREEFGVGNVAPDIVGVDLDGVAFKLSDYKGKVIMVDFWGDW